MSNFQVRNLTTLGPNLKRRDMNTQNPYDFPGARYLFVSLNLSMKVWVIGFPAMGSTSLRLGADILEGSFGPPPRQPFISARTTFECFEVFAIGSSMRRIHREQTCPNGVCQSLDSVN
jgi:hypothetical protein